MNINKNRILTFLYQLPTSALPYPHPSQTLHLYTHLELAFVICSPSQQVRGRCRPTRQRGLSRIHGRSLPFLSPPRQNSFEVSAHTPISPTADLNIVSTPLLTSTAKDPMIPAISNSSREQLAEIVSKCDRLATFANDQKCVLHELKSNLFIVSVEKKALIATVNDQEKQILSLQSESLEAQHLLQELQEASNSEKKVGKKVKTFCQI